MMPPSTGPIAGAWPEQSRHRPPGGTCHVIAPPVTRKPPAGEEGPVAEDSPPPTAARAGDLALLVPVGGDTYALPLAAVREVAVDPRVTTLPTAPRVVLGLFNLRGQIVPLLDTGRLLGLRGVERSDFAVLVETGHGIAGLAATAIPLTVRLSEAVGSSDLEASTETFLVCDRRLAVALDVAELLSPARISR